MHVDQDIVVVEKPAGLPLGGESQRDRPSKLGVFEHVSRGLGGPNRPAGLWRVHDMDREASGLCVFARHKRASDAMREWMKKQGTRIYSAVIVLPSEDAPDPEATTIQTLLRPNRRGVADVVPQGSELDRGADAPGEGGGGGAAFTVRAVTQVQPRERTGRLALVRLRAETDHPFQLRAHLAWRGTPILGDRAYGAPAGSAGRLCLHADELTFEHPRTRETVRFRVKVPEALKSALSGPVEPPMESARAADANAGSSSVAPAKPSGWDHVAEWYAEHLSSTESDHQVEIVRPGVIELLEEAMRSETGDLSGRLIVDVACGEGALSRELAARGAGVVGVDAAAKLIEVAQQRAGTGAVAERLRYEVADAETLSGVADESFDAATCVLALMNIGDMDAVVRSIARVLRPGGVFVGVVIHPAFRSPGRTGWGWDEGAHGVVQYRRVEAYLSETVHEIVMNPGAVSSGAEAVITHTYVRPTGAYVNALGAAGLLVDRVEEWASRRVSKPGPRADAENLARREIPMFLAVRGRKVVGGAMGGGQ